MAVAEAARRAIAGFAAGTAVPVFPAIGAGALDRVESLRLRPELRLVDSPRHATVLLVAGAIPPRFQEALDRVHDQIPHPRATLHWGAEAPVPGLADGRASTDTPTSIAAGDDPASALVDLHRTGLLHADTSEPHRLRDRPPAPWRGRGDHGQGGEGMMGGTPYGRPMAMTDDDIRDGLALDRLPFTLGPFFPPFPPGLVLDLALQGDVIQSVELLARPFPQPGAGSTADEASARRLRRVSRVLRAAGAGPLADRALRLASNPSAAGIARLGRWLRSSGSLLMIPPVPLPDGTDARERLRGDIEASGDPERTPGTGSSDAVDRASRHLVDTLPGLEWGEAVVLIASLDLTGSS